MKTRPEMTDDEIRSYMDFDRLLEMHKKTPTPRNFLNTRYLLILGFVTGVGIVSWIMLFERNSVAGETQTAAENKSEVTSDTNVIADSSSNQTSSDVLKQDGALETQITTHKREVKPQPNKTSDQTLTYDSVQKKNEVQHDREKPAVNLVYVQAAPVNGYPDLYEYFNRELKYPQEAIKDSIRGEVIAVFTINTQGSPERIVIENSLGPLFDKEVVRLITNMPPWKPATYNNNAVASKMSLPLTFQIEKISSKK